jgi:small-conductance mechanosensitive channel
MSIKDVLSKIKKDGYEKLSDEEKALVDGFDPDTEANSRASKARKEAEGKAKTATDALTVELEELKEKYDAIEAGKGNETEQMQRKIDKGNERLEASQAEVAKLKETSATSSRQIAIDEIGARINWKQETGNDYRKFALKKALEGVDTDELTNDSIVSPILENIRESNKAHIAADGGHGTGQTAHTGDATTGATSTKSKDALNLARTNPKEYLKQRDEIWANADKE